MDEKIDWKDIIKSGLHGELRWDGDCMLLLALRTILIVIDYVNEFQYLGLGILWHY